MKRTKPFQFCVLFLSLVKQAKTGVVPSARFHYTYTHTTGNRVVRGRSNFPNATRIDVTLKDGDGSTIAWAVGTSSTSSNAIHGEGVGFVVTTVEGEAYMIGPASSGDNDGTWHTSPVLGYSPLHPEQPPLVRVSDGGERVDGKSMLPTVEVVSFPAAEDVAPLSHPIPVPSSDDGVVNTFAYIATNGDLVLYDVNATKELDRLDSADALPDGRIVFAKKENGTGVVAWMALYGGRTDEYRHCVLGDCLESKRLILVEVAEETASSASLVVMQDMRLPDGEVYEGMSPMFIKEGGMTLVVTTVAAPGRGARLQVYNLDGEVVSVGPEIGWGWRHQLFYDSFLPLSSSEDQKFLVDVLTPHVGKTVEFFDLSLPAPHEGGSDDTKPAPAQMDRVASLSSYTTHAIGSRNLDSAVCGDWNGDGSNEAVVLSDDRRELVGIQLREMVASDGSKLRVAEEAWRKKLPKVSTSNVAAVDSWDGTQAALGIGCGNVFRIWLPTSIGDGSERASDRPSNGPSSGPSNGPSTTSEAAYCNTKISVWVTTLLLFAGQMYLVFILSQ